MECRYSFGRYFTDCTITAHPLSDELSVKEKTLLLQQHKPVLNSVKNILTHT